GHQPAGYQREGAGSAVSGWRPPGPAHRESACRPVAQPAGDALDRLLQTLQGIGIGKAYVLGGAMMAEIQAWGDGHMLGFDEVLAQVLAIVTESGGVGVQVKSTVGRLGNAEAQLAQRRQQKIGALVEGGPT